MPKKDNSLEILGIKPVANSLNIATKGTVEGVSAFLSRICLPAAEEFGLLLRDNVSTWRANNAVKIAAKAQSMVEKRKNNNEINAHPKIIYSAIENGSWAEDEFIQNLWAGLLASSCTDKGNDEGNLIFISILAQLTANQAKLISYACENAKTFESEAGWIFAETLNANADDLVKIMGIDDLQQIDRELDHLRSLELINGGFLQGSKTAIITPHALCLQLYVRSQGFIGSPIEYFGCSKKEDFR